MLDIQLGVCLCCRPVPDQAAFEGEDNKSLVCRHSCNPGFCELVRSGLTGMRHLDVVDVLVISRPLRLLSYVGMVVVVSMSTLCCRSQAQVPLRLLSRAYAGTGFGDDAADWEGGGLKQ